MKRKKWVVVKAVVRAKRRLSDTGMSITVETPQKDELPLYQEALDFRCKVDGHDRGFPVSLDDAERFAREVLGEVDFVRKRLAEKGS